MFNSGAVAAWELENAAGRIVGQPLSRQLLRRLGRRLGASRDVAEFPLRDFRPRLLHPRLHRGGGGRRGDDDDGRVLRHEPVRDVRRRSHSRAGQQRRSGPRHGRRREQRLVHLHAANADFGNAEVSELYYPIIYLGRNVEPDSGGYGKFRGGLGHTAVWMIKNTPGIEYQCGCAGMRSKVVGNHGMFGAYPAWPDRASYAHDTNVKELIDGAEAARARARRSRGARPGQVHQGREHEPNVVAPFVTPEQLRRVRHRHPPHLRRPGTRRPDRARPRAVRDRTWTRAGRAPASPPMSTAVVAKDGKRRVDRRRRRDRAEARRDARTRARSAACRSRSGGSRSAKRVEAGEDMAQAVKEMWQVVDGSCRPATPPSCGRSGSCRTTSRSRGDHRWHSTTAAEDRTARRRQAAVASRPGDHEGRQGQRPLREVGRHPAAARPLEGADPAAADARRFSSSRRAPSASSSAVAGRSSATTA